jgi:hypothetical protein
MSDENEKPLEEAEDITQNVLKCVTISNDIAAAKCGGEREEGDAENERSHVG